MRDRYKNLEIIGKMLSRSGSIIKLLAAIPPTVGAAMGIYWLNDSQRGEAIIVFAGGLSIGLGVYIIGIFLMAFGESLFALADIATNSWGQGGAPASSALGEPAKGIVDQVKAYSPHGTFDLAGACFCNGCRLAVVPGKPHVCKVKFTE